MGLSLNHGMLKGFGWKNVSHRKEAKRWDKQKLFYLLRYIHISCFIAIPGALRHLTFILPPIEPQPSHKTPYNTFAYHFNFFALLWTHFDRDTCAMILQPMDYTSAHPQRSSGLKGLEWFGKFIIHRLCQRIELSTFSFPSVYTLHWVVLLTQLTILDIGDQ